MSYQIKKEASIYIIGIECRTINLPDRAPQEIAAHWERFYRERIADQIPNKSSDKIVGLYCHYEGVHTQADSLVAGSPVSSLAEVPEGMVGEKIPAAHYAAFHVVGDFPQKLIEAWEEVWKGTLPRTYRYDLEIYNAPP